LKLFWATIAYRLKALFTTAHGIVFLALALLLAFAPFIGLIIPDAPVPIGWIDEDDTDFSHKLLERVEALEVVWVTIDERETLIANLQTGRLEGVFVIKEGFEDALKGGEFEETLQLLRSPYSTAAGVISESVGGEAIHLWLTCSAANEAAELDPALYDAVFEDIIVGTELPIISIMRLGAAGQTDNVSPLRDAAYTSLYLLAALGCFFMLTGLAMAPKNNDFAARLISRDFSLARYRLAVGIADAAYLLPCAAVPAVAFGIARAGAPVLTLLIMFALYMLAYAGVASMVSRIANQTMRLLLISVITIATVLFGSLLIPLPSGGWATAFAYLLPSRWLSSLQRFGALKCVAGLAVCALIYNIIPFFIKKEDI